VAHLVLKNGHREVRHLGSKGLRLCVSAPHRGVVQGAHQMAGEHFPLGDHESNYDAKPQTVTRLGAALQASFAANAGF
jgi:hypothetical protein